MAIRLFSDLISRVSPNAPGCPDPVLQDYIRNAAIDVCERTNAWKYEHPIVLTVAGTYEYNFVPETDSEVYSVLTASINGTPMVKTTLDVVNQAYPKYPSSVEEERATPRYILQIDPATFHVALVPDNDTDEITMYISQRPTRAATGMKESVMDDLEDAIMHGALQQLLTLPERPWSNTELAAYHAKQYIFKVTERRARATITATRAAPSVRFNSWA